MVSETHARRGSHQPQKREREGEGEREQDIERERDCKSFAVRKMNQSKVIDSFPYIQPVRKELCRLSLLFERIWHIPDKSRPDYGPDFLQ